jgi:Winged helix DNA-binding domain
MTMTWAQVCARRLERHGLIAPVALKRLAEQVGVICGAHAQMMSAAELSIGLRVAGADQAAVRDALWAERSLVKTYGPRGTVHLLPAHDLAMWSGALSAAIEPVGFAPDIRLTPAQTDAVVAAIADALGDAELTIDELHDAVVARTGPWAADRVMPAFQELWPRWRQAITAAAHRGALCFGPSRGRNVTYTNPRRWVPGFAPLDAESALRGLVRRFLYAYGPATPQQFAQWLGAPRSWASTLFDTLAAELEPVEVDGGMAWVSAGDTQLPESPPSGVRLLPHFDVYAIGCHPRERLFAGHAADRALSRGQAGTLPVLLVDGVVAGVWHQKRSGRRLALTVEPLLQLTAQQRSELEDQAEQVGALLGSTAELSIGAVTVRKHL